MSISAAARSYNHLYNTAMLADSHRLLVEAIASGDPERAGAVMHAHLMGRRTGH